MQHLIQMMASIGTRALKSSAHTGHVRESKPIIPSTKSFHSIKSWQKRRRNPCPSSAGSGAFLGRFRELWLCCREGGSALLPLQPLGCATLGRAQSSRENPWEAARQQKKSHVQGQHPRASVIQYNLKTSFEPQYCVFKSCWLYLDETARWCQFVARQESQRKGSS